MSESHRQVVSSSGELAERETQDKSNHINGLGEPLLTCAEVAAYLRMNVKAFYRFFKREGVPHIQLGREYHFKASDVRDWLRQHRRR